MTRTRETTIKQSVVLTEIQQENDKLRADLGKLLGAAKAYVGADPQVRGELFRDLVATVEALDNPEWTEYGWPAAYYRLDKENNRLQTELDNTQERVAKLESEAELHEDVTAEYAAKCSMLETANKRIAQTEADLKDCGFSSLADLFQSWNELDDENEELKKRIAELPAKESPRTAMERRIYEALLPVYWAAHVVNPPTDWELAGTALNAAKRATQVWIDSEHERAERARRDENTDTQGDTI